MKFPPGFNEYFEKRVALVEHLLGKHVLALFRLDEDEAPLFEGSCVPVLVGDKHFLVSAGHVFDATTTGGVHLLLRGREQSPLEQPARVTVTQYPLSRHDDLVDIGIVPLTGDEASAVGTDAFLRLSLDADRPVASKYSRLVVFGFPTKRQKRDDAALAYNLTQTRFASPEMPDATVRAAGLDSRHFAMNFDHRRIASAKGRGGKPNLKGMSGGGVWMLDPYVDYSEAHYPAFVGFMVGSPARNKKILFGPRVTVLRDLLTAEALEPRAI